MSRLLRLALACAPAALPAALGAQSGVTDGTSNTIVFGESTTTPVGCRVGLLPFVGFGAPTIGGVAVSGYGCRVGVLPALEGTPAPILPPAPCSGALLPFVEVPTLLPFLEGTTTPVGGCLGTLLPYLDATGRPYGAPAARPGCRVQLLPFLDGASSPSGSFGLVADGTSNTIVLGSAGAGPGAVGGIRSILACVGASGCNLTPAGITDGTSNTVLLGERPEPNAACALGSGAVAPGAAGCLVGGGTVTDGSSNTIVLGEACRPSSVSVAPEPGTWALLASGLVVLGGVARRRRIVPHPSR